MHLHGASNSKSIKENKNRRKKKTTSYSGHQKIEEEKIVW